MRGPFELVLACGEVVCNHPRHNFPQNIIDIQSHEVGLGEKELYHRCRIERIGIVWLRGDGEGIRHYIVDGGGESRISESSNEDTFCSSDHEAIVVGKR